MGIVKSGNSKQDVPKFHFKDLVTLLYRHTQVLTHNNKLISARKLCSYLLRIINSSIMPIQYCRYHMVLSFTALSLSLMKKSANSVMNHAVCIYSKTLQIRNRTCIQLGDRGVNLALIISCSGKFDKEE